MFILLLFGGDFIFQCWKIGYIVDREDIVWYEYCSGCGVNGCDNVFGVVKLFYGFDQQWVVVKVFGVFNFVG